MSDIIARVMSHAPVDTTYVAGLWHPGRASLRGIQTEARVLASSLIKPRNKNVHKFLIIGRARSGSTLLTRLLNAHPDVQCDRELLSKRVLFPRTYLNRLAHKSTDKAFGMKLLSYQMAQVQRLSDPIGFLARLQQDGFRLIHLERESFGQTMSLITAQTSRVFHQRDGTVGDLGRGSWGRHDRIDTDARSVDVDDFVKRLTWSDLLLQYEKHCLKNVPHLKISYDRDLADEARHQATAAHVFDWIGVPAAPTPVSSGMKKVLPPDLRQMIANYDALSAAITQVGLGHLLPA